MRFFKGGINPLSRKKTMSKIPLRNLEFPPSHVILPFRSPCGETVTPVVSVGDSVSMGELVAVPSSEFAVPLHSSVSGSVVGLSHYPHPFMGLTLSITIENDQLNTKVPMVPCKNVEALTGEEILSLVKERGIQGMSRDTRSVYHKISEGKGKVSTVIVNGIESEPYLTGDYRLLKERQDTILLGAKLLAKATGAEKIVFAVQADKVDAIEAYDKNIHWDNGMMSVRTLPNKYPFGEEKLVVSYIMKKELHQNQPCHQANCILFNVATVQAVGEGIRDGLPQIYRSFSVTGGAVKHPCNYWLPIGTPLSTLIENVGGMKMTPGATLLGGPMSGVKPQDLTGPVLVNSTGLSVLAPWEVPKYLRQGEEEAVPFPCVRCGNCIRVCPQHLRPYLVYQTMGFPEKSRIEKAHPEDCISCGCCNYSCPAHLPLAQTMQQAQDFLREYRPIKPEKDVKIYAPEEKSGYDDIELEDDRDIRIYKDSKETTLSSENTENLEKSVEEEQINLVESHETTVESQETTVESQETTVKSQETTVESQETTVESQETTVESPETTVESLESTEETQEPTVESHGNTLESQENTVESQETTVESPEPTVKSPEPTVGSQETTVESQETTVESLESTEETQETTVESQETTEESQETVEESHGISTEEKQETTVESLEPTLERQETVEESHGISTEENQETVEDRTLHFLEFEKSSDTTATTMPTEVGALLEEMVGMALDMVEHDPNHIIETQKQDIPSEVEDMLQEMVDFALEMVEPSSEHLEENLEKEDEMELKVIELPEIESKEGGDT